MSLSPGHLPTPLRWLSTGTLCLALAACDTPPTVVDQHFGLAVQRAQAQQSQLAPGTALPMPWRCPPPGSAPYCNPQRARDGLGQGMHHGMHPGMGRGPAAAASNKQRTDHDTDGASALSAVTRYQQSFQTPSPPAPVFNIGLGAASAP